MSPIKTTTNPAPLFSFTSVTVILKSVGAPSNFALSLNEYCVLAMHIGKLPNQFFSIKAIFSFILSFIITSSAL